MINAIIEKRIDLCVPEITFDQLQDLRERFTIPGDAIVRQNDDDYDLCITWKS